MEMREHAAKLGRQCEISHWEKQKPGGTSYTGL